MKRVINGLLRHGEMRAKTFILGEVVAPVQAQGELGPSNRFDGTHQAAPWFLIQRPWSRATILQSTSTSYQLIASAVAKETYVPIGIVAQMQTALYKDLQLFNICLCT